MTLPFNVDSTWLDSATVSLNAGELRRADAAMFAGDGSSIGVSGGVVRHGDSSLAVSVDGSDVVTIQPGSVVIPGNAVTGTGPYRAGIASAVTGSLTARNATNPRIDLLVFRQMDTDVVAGHGAYTGRIQLIDGTPSATPGVPTMPSMAVELARITVPATGGGAAIPDLSFRTYAAAIGARIAVPTSARLPASGGAIYQRAVALDTGKEYFWNGTAWFATNTSGTFTIPVVSGGGGTLTQAVTFPVGRFATVPNVQVSVGNPRLNASVKFLTTSGFTFEVFNWTSSAMAGPTTGYWLATDA